MIVILFPVVVGSIAAIGRTQADCLVGDIMYREGDSLGHIGLECLDKSQYDGLQSWCGPDGDAVDEEKVFTCTGSVPYCVQRGPRGWGAAVCLSEPEETLGEYDKCGETITNKRCEPGLICYTGFDPNCDEDCADANCPGVCRRDVTPSNPGLCGGFAGFPCPPGSECVDRKGDGCTSNPNCNVRGADCGGICLNVREPEPTHRLKMTRQECTDQGGSIVGDIGNGAIHRDDYVCKSSGESPVGTIVPAPGEQIAFEGEVCCGGGLEPPLRPEMTRQECTDQGGIIVGDIGNGAVHRDDYICDSSEEPPIGRIVYAPGKTMPIEGEVCCGSGVPDPINANPKCCDPKVGPGGCPDANGSFNGCWDEGGYCCSDGKWYADFGDGSNNCEDNELGDAKPCECTDYECCIYIGGYLNTDAPQRQCYDSRSGKTFAKGCSGPKPEEAEPTSYFDCIDGDWALLSSQEDKIVCPDGQDPIPNTFCGRGPNRKDCEKDEFCHIHPADRFAVCCPKGKKTNVLTRTIGECRTKKRRICSKCKNSVCDRPLKCNGKRQCRKKLKNKMKTCIKQKARHYRKVCIQPRIRLSTEARNCGVPKC